MKIERTFEIVDHFKSQFRDRTLLHAKKNQKWVGITAEDFANKIEKLSLYLIYSGIQRSEVVATIFSNNTSEWNIIDLALAQIGAIHLPIYPTLSESDYLFILNQAAVRWVFITDQSIYNKLSVLLCKLPLLQNIISIEKLPKVECFENILVQTLTNQNELSDTLQIIKRGVKSMDVCTTIYTSGTTGFPKGVMLTHRNICTNILAAAALQPLGNGHKVISFLPLCHMYERVAVYQFLYNGAQVYYAENLKSMLANMREIRPDGTTVVPRVLEKIVINLHGRAHNSGFIKKHFMHWCLKYGFQFKPYSRLRWTAKLIRVFADIIFYRSVRSLLGGKIKYVGCGGAPVAARILNFFWAAGIPVFEGYGLTECSPLVSLNFPGQNNILTGSVGPAINDVQIRIADDSEILVKGPNVMKCYYKNDELTDRTIIDGWLHTGDLGEIIEDRFLKIIGRKKEMFKTSYGKYIVPRAIESLFIDSPIIDHLIVTGEGRHCAAAIVSPDFRFCRRNILKQFNGTNNELIALPEIKKIIRQEIDKVNRQLGKTEQINKYLLVPDVWTIESGELSATHKLRRNIIINKYAAGIRELYREDEIDDL
jgi:long-chain acyl-CoA synthetase